MPAWSVLSTTSSSRDASTALVIPTWVWTPVVENVKSAADIGHDSRRHRILIPIFTGNTAILQPYE